MSMSNHQTGCVHRTGLPLGPVRLLDDRPDLPALSALVQPQGAAAGERRTQLRADVFDTATEARFVLTREAKPLDANQAAEGFLAAEVLRICPKTGALSFDGAKSDRRLLEALTETFTGDRLCRRLVLQDAKHHWRAIQLSVFEAHAGLWILSIRGGPGDVKDAIEPLTAAFDLTPTEAEVLAHLVAGAVPKEIARRMRNSTHTIRSHLRALFRKMGAQGITGALRQSIELIW